MGLIMPTSRLSVGSPRNSRRIDSILMATVRTTAPRHDGNGGGNGGGNKKRKRSRSGSSSRPLATPAPGTSGGGGSGVANAELAAVRAALVGLEKWQLAVNIGAWRLALAWWWAGRARRGFLGEVGSPLLTVGCPTLDMSEIRKECMRGRLSVGYRPHGASVHDLPGVKLTVVPCCLR
jgi:hypothetical protein